MTFDVDAARAFALKVWKYKEGELVSLMIHLGDRLGLYASLADGASTSPRELAARAGLDERWVTEWMLGQAAAGLLLRDGDGTYTMTAEAASVLVDEDSLLFASGGFSGGVAPSIVDRIADAFRTGVGFSYGDMDDVSALQVDRMNSASLRNFLVPVVIPALDGVVAKLESGARVLDLGCGGGTALLALAAAWPQGTYVGVDSSQHAIALAEERTANLDNVTVSLARGEDFEHSEPYDLVLTLEFLHDVPHPDRIAAAVRDSIEPDGTWLIKDMRCGPTYESNAANPLLAMMYGFSLTSCLPSGTATADGAGLGTLGLPPGDVESLARRAGFSSFRVHDLDDPVHYYYEARP